MALAQTFVALFILLASTFVLGVPTPPTSTSKTCRSNEFYYEDKDCCLPRGGPSVPHPPPPPEKSCPPSHYWNKDYSCCVPYNPPAQHAPPPQCSNGYVWNAATYCCEAPTPTAPHHGHKPSHTPHHHGHSGDEDGNDDDQGEDNDGQGEDHDHQGEDHDHHGEDNDHQGEHHDHDHGHGGYTKRSAISLCPRSLTACPVSSLGYEYECLDTTAELRSCGGCASTGEGQDCTAIKGAWNVGCEAGTCAVYTCALGFRVAPDGKSCEAL